MIPDFTVSASGGQTVTPGNSAAYTVTIGGLNGFGGTVTLSLAGLPSGATATFNPTSVAGGGGATTMTVSTVSSTPGGSFPLTITGTSGSLSHTATTTLTVNAFTTIRVNGGASSAYTDSQGNVWAADNGFQNGTTWVTGNAIGNTPDPTLYRMDHYNNGNLIYQASVPNGSYLVTLKFAELTFSAPGGRLFHIQINGVTLATNVDVFLLSGGANRAYDMSYPVTVTGGQIAVTIVQVASVPILNAISIQALSAFTPVRVNAGGGAYSDVQGNLWSVDSGFLNGFTWVTGNGIANTPDPTLYRMDRYNNPGNLVYQAGVPNGKYVVTLKFAELSYSAPGQRIFSIQINGTQVATNVDLFALTGGINRAYDLSYPVTVTGGLITVTSVQGVSVPILNAIAIVGVQ